LLVVEDTAVQERLERSRHEYDAELQKRSGGELAWFRAMEQKFLNVAVGTDAPDPDAYRELFDRVRGLPVLG